jgi:S1-C subfamily serine protease
MNALPLATIARRWGWPFAVALALTITLPVLAQPERSSDEALLYRLEREGGRLVEQHRTAGNLRGQLSRAACEIPLAPVSDRALPPAEVIRAAEGGVVVIGEFYLCDKCSRQHLGTASGFFLTESGALATCYHVVSRTNTTGIVVLTRDGRILPVTGVLAANRAADVAVLQVEGRDFTPLPLSTNAPAGMPVLVLSHPDAHFFSATSGMVSRYFTLTRRKQTTTWMAITAGFAKGSSGAPVLDAHGNVVGLVDNTESIYYDDSRRKQQQDLQMVINNCAPAAALLNLVKPPKTARQDGTAAAQ